MLHQLRYNPTNSLSLRLLSALLGKMRRFYAHILVCIWLILYIAKLISVTPAFCLTFITKLVTLNGGWVAWRCSFYSWWWIWDNVCWWQGLELSHLNCLILNVATNRAWLAIFWAFHVCYCTNSCILCWYAFYYFYLYLDYDFVIK